MDGLEEFAKDPAAALEALRAIIESAETDPVLAERLTQRSTSVAVHLGPDPLVVTVRFDRRPIVVNDGADEDAEVHLYGEPRHVLMTMSGERQLAMLIARGEVAYTGPVRKVLRLMPILRYETRSFIERVTTGAPAVS